MPNPNVPQGILNRLRTSLTFPDNPNLNITAPYLGKASVRIVPEGEITQMPGTLTGTVISPEPFLMMSAVCNLVISQPLANSFKLRWETNAALGDLTVRTHATTLSVFQILNTAITGFQEISTAGDVADLLVTIKGYYQINSSLFGG